MDFAADGYLSEGQNPPPHNNVYLHTIILIYTENGEGGRVEPEKRLRGNSSQSWVENTDITGCISTL